MKKILLGIGFATVFSAACQSANTTVTTVNSNTAVVQNSNSLIASSHSAANMTVNTAQMPNDAAHSGVKTMPPNDASPGASAVQTGGFMSGQARAIDTTALAEAVSKAEKAYKAKSSDETAKRALADAYADRAFALTESAQYRSALGDFRKCLKLDPNNADAQKMHDQIVSIFKSLNREVPVEGAEPTPLPFKKS